MIRMQYQGVMSGDGYIFIPDESGAGEHAIMGFIGPNLVYSTVQEYAGLRLMPGSCIFSSRRVER